MEAIALAELTTSSRTLKMGELESLEVRNAGKLAENWWEDRGDDGPPGPGGEEKHPASQKNLARQYRNYRGVKGMGSDGLRVWLLRECGKE